LIPAGRGFSSLLEDKREVLISFDDVIARLLCFSFDD
jgi:hypothetical protein